MSPMSVTLRNWMSMASSLSAVWVYCDNRSHFRSKISVNWGRVFERFRPESATLLGRGQAPHISC